mmetsp:Transcript_24258/g.41088  ORF Transcript_24258/g.41088 Transcript_24258/m.41088 type:complete len:239 (+) Transcript_24258:294-1010(+)
MRHVHLRLVRHHDFAHLQSIFRSVFRSRLGRAFCFLSVLGLRVGDDAAGHEEVRAAFELDRVRHVLGSRRELAHAREGALAGHGVHAVPGLERERGYHRLVLVLVVFAARGEGVVLRRHHDAFAGSSPLLSLWLQGQLHERLAALAVGQARDLAPRLAVLCVRRLHQVAELHLGQGRGHGSAQRGAGLLHVEGRVPAQARAFAAHALAVAATRGGEVLHLVVVRLVAFCALVLHLRLG